MPHCIYCGAPFAEASAEHVLQNALGARWVSRRIVCDPHQQLLGDTIDLELANQAAVFRSLFNHETGRGGPARTLRNVPTVEGKVVALDPGGILQLNEPEVIVRDHPNGPPGSKSVEFRLRSKKDIGQALHLLRQQLPNAVVDEKTVAALSRTVRQDVVNTVILRAPTAGHEYHRATAKAVFNLAAASGIDVSDPCFDAYRAFVLCGAGDSADFVRFATSHGFVPPKTLSGFDHFVGVAATGPVVEGYLQLYGCLQYVFRLANSYPGPAFAHGYIVNPLRDSVPAEIRDPDLLGSSFPRFDEQPPLPNEAVRSWATQKIGNVVASHKLRSELRASLENVLSAYKDQPPTPELNREISEKIAHALAAKLREIRAAEPV